MVFLRHHLSNKVCHFGLFFLLHEVGICWVLECEASCRDLVEWKAPALWKFVFRVIDPDLLWFLSRQIERQVLLLPWEGSCLDDLGAWFLQLELLGHLISFFVRVRHRRCQVDLRVLHLHSHTSWVDPNLNLTRRSLHHITLSFRQVSRERAWNNRLECWWISERLHICLTCRWL